MGLALRPYQRDATRAVIDGWDGGQLAQLIGAATGSGKTEMGAGVLASELREGRLTRALWIAHTEQLIWQPYERFAEHWPELPKAGVVMAEHDEPAAALVFGTIQTLSNRRRLERVLEAGPFSHFVLDEAHHARARTFEELIGRLNQEHGGMRHLGLTATPERTDRLGLAEIYGKRPAYTVDVKSLIQMGYLVPIKAHTVRTEISIRAVTQSEGDYTDKGLAEAFATENCLDLVVASHQQYAAGRRAIAFLPSVKAAYRLAEKFRAAGIAAAAVDATTPSAERRRVLADLRSGRLEVLCNMNLYTEGFDEPTVSALHMVRPTKSKPLYQQMAGRGLRLCPEITKQDLLILDYAPVEGRDLIMADDLLGKRDDGSAASSEESESVGGEGVPDKQSGVTGDPDALYLADLDLLRESRHAWDYAGRDWWLLPIEAGVSLVLAPARGAGGKYTLWLAEPKSTKLIGSSARLADVYQQGEMYAAVNGSGNFSDPGRPWRKEPASERQRDLIASFGYPVPADLRKGEASKAISFHFAERNIKRAMRFTRI